MRRRQSQCKRDVMFDRVCKLSSVKQPMSRWAQSHTPKHKTITRSETDADRQEPVTQAQAYTLLRNEMCLLSYNIMKQNRPEKHDHIPSHPDTPHPSLSLSPNYRPICSANCSISPSLYYWTTFPACLSPLLQRYAHTHYWSSPSLPLSLSLLPSLSDLGCFLFPSVSLEVHWREEKEMKENASDAPTCIWLSISMVAWPPETAHHAPLHTKRTESWEGEEQVRLWRGERAVVMKQTSRALECELPNTTRL